MTIESLKLMFAKLPARKSLSWEIAFVLIIKLIALYIIWAVCFSHPTDKTLSSKDVLQHVVGMNAIENVD